MSSRVPIYRRSIQGVAGQGELTGDRLWVTCLKPRVDSHLEKISLYIDGSGSGTGNQKFRAVVYSDSSGAPNARLGYSADTTVIDGQAPGWVHVAFAVPIAVIAASNYWVGIHADSAGAATIRLSYGTPTIAWKYGDAEFDNPPPVTFPSPTTVSPNASYALYGTLVPDLPLLFGYAVEAVNTEETAVVDGEVRLGRFDLDEGALVSKLSACLRGSGVNPGLTGKVRGMIYTDNAGVPGTLKGTSAEVTVQDADAKQWFDLSFSAPVGLVAGAYWLGIWTGATSNVVKFVNASDNGNDFAVQKTGTTYSSSGDGPSIVSPTLSVRVPLVYASYTRPMVHLFLHGTAGEQDGTLVSEGGSLLTPVEAGPFPTGQSSLGSAIRIGIRCTDGTSRSGDCTIDLDGATKAKWRLGTDNSGLPIWAPWGASITVSDLTDENQVFWLQARTTPDEAEMADTSVALVFPNDA